MKQEEYKRFHLEYLSVRGIWFPMIVLTFSSMFRHNQLKENNVSAFHLMRDTNQDKHRSIFLGIL